MVAATLREKAKPVNPLDGMMTSAQIARRKFKSSLPRKIENRRLSAMEALGETFTLFDRFRTMVAEEGQNPDVTLHAALAYCQPEADPAMLATTLLLPGPAKVGKFSGEIVELDRPLFLGIVFIQLDPDTDNPNYKWVSFCAQFLAGPEADGRLMFAQKMCLAKIAKTAKELKPGKYYADI